MSERAPDPGLPSRARTDTDRLRDSNARANAAAYRLKVRQGIASAAKADAEALAAQRGQRPAAEVAAVLRGMARQS